MAHYENASGALVFPGVLADQFETVFDFGCGCGRTARQLLLQKPRPKHYVGIDRDREQVDWCRRNLSPVDRAFVFLHHDVGGAERRLRLLKRKPLTAPFPAENHAFTLVNAHSVFTHLVEEQAAFYLAEAARIVRKDGVVRTTWFLFDKRDFSFFFNSAQHALYRDYEHPGHAVAFDKNWVAQTAAAAGLTVVGVEAPTIRGHQWVLLMVPSEPGVEAIEIPEDEAPRAASVEDYVKVGMPRPRG